MNRNEEIIVTVDADGGIAVEVKGVRGKRCLALTEELEQVLGSVEKRALKTEYRLQEEAGIRQKIGGR